MNIIVGETFTPSSRDRCFFGTNKEDSSTLGIRDTCYVPIEMRTDVWIRCQLTKVLILQEERRGRRCRVRDMPFL